jgi:hypothetical protein
MRRSGMVPHKRLEDGRHLEEVVAHTFHTLVLCSHAPFTLFRQYTRSLLTFSRSLLTLWRASFDT